MKYTRSILLTLMFFSLVVSCVGAQVTDEPYVNPPVTYDYSGDSDSSTDSVVNFSPDDEAIYIKVIMFNPTGTETHRIEVYNPAGELYFYEDFGAESSSGWSGDFGDYQIESRVPIKDTPAADMPGLWDIVVYFQVGESLAGPESYTIKHLHEFHIAIRELGRREIWIEDITYDEEVAPGALASVDLKVGWIFDSTTSIKPGIYNPETGVYEDQTEDTVGSEASKTYSLEFDAPTDPGTYTYQAEVPYRLNDEWVMGDDAQTSFEITVVAPAKKQIGIPGFPAAAVWLGLITALLWMSRQNRSPLLIP
ncbi:MAG: hypothetical protein NWE88_01730 [Candidatus Bathyarchaeota archaeon]|nr:hypothetical protein [Candidatus Bathyarchaeota archaeon]